MNTVIRVVQQNHRVHVLRGHVVQRQEAHDALHALDADRADDPVRVVGAAVVRTHDSLRVPRRAGSVDERRTAPGKRRLDPLVHFRVAHLRSQREEGLPRVQLRKGIFGELGKRLLLPVHDDGAKQRQLLADRQQLPQLLARLTHANHALGVLQDVLACFLAVGRVDARRDASRQPRTVESEVVLGRVEADEAHAVLQLKAHLDRRLGEGQGVCIVVCECVDFIFLADDGMDASVLRAAATELLCIRIHDYLKRGKWLLAQG